MTDFLDALERQLIDAVERHTRDGVRLPARRRLQPRSTRSQMGVVSARMRPWPIALGVLASLLAVVLALVVPGVLGGGHGSRSGRQATANAAVGLPARGHSRLASLSVADPAGGAPWGMRIVRTATNLVCLQVGQLESGRLRALDRTLRLLAPARLRAPGDVEGDGVVHTLPPPAPPAGVIGDGLVESQQGPGAAHAPQPPAGERCRPAGSELVDYGAGVAQRRGERPLRHSQQRMLSFGLLGPDALSVSYRLRGRSRTQAVEPGTGAYLIVLPQAAAATSLDVTYRHSGRICRIAVEPVSDGSTLVNACPLR